MLRYLILLGLTVMGGACKKETPEPLKPTLLSVQVIYQQTRQPVDSARVVVAGTKGSYLSGREFQTFLDSYTDKQGRLQVSMSIPRDYRAHLICSKTLRVGDQYKTYSTSYLQPKYEVLTHEQENNYTAQLDTLK